MEKKELQNQNVYIRIDSDGIFARDLKDEYNIPSMFTQSKRGLKNVIKEVIEKFNDTMDFYSIIYTCRLYNVKYHHYCAMD